MLPVAGNRHQLVRSIPQLFAQIIDEELNAALLANHPCEGLARDWFC